MYSFDLPLIFWLPQHTWNLLLRCLHPQNRQSKKNTKNNSLTTFIIRLWNVHHPSACGPWCLHNYHCFELNLFAVTLNTLREHTSKNTLLFPAKTSAQKRINFSHLDKNQTTIRNAERLMMVQTLHLNLTPSPRNRWSFNETSFPKHSERWKQNNEVLNR